MPVINKITELFVKLKDGIGNNITSTDMGGGKRGLDVNAEFSGNIGAVKIEDADSSDKVIVDPNGRLYVSVQEIVNVIVSQIPDIVIKDSLIPSNTAKVDASGNIYVVSPQPETPAGKTGVSEQLSGTLSGTHSIYTVIPSGKKIIIQRFRAGSEADSNGGSVFSLYYAPNGNSTGLEIIEEIYTNGNSIPVPLNYETVVGDGTKALLLRFEHLSGGAVRTFTKWEGYY